MSFTNVFGNNTLPPAEYGYRALTITTNTTLLWPYNTDDATIAVAKIMDVSCAAGNILTVPDARQVSTGEDFLVRNVGTQTLTLKQPSGAALQTIVAGTAVYFYLTDNTTEDGEYGSVVFGSGASSVDAATLVGYGIKAIGVSLNQAHSVTTVASSSTIDNTYRAKVVVNTGGAITINLESAITLGNDFFFCLRNSGTGTVTIDPDGSTLIDEQGTLSLQPGESMLLFCSGSAWYSVGYGRSTVYQFTQLVKDVSAAGTFTLSATEAGNKLITFAGNPASGVTVVVPSVVSVYYLDNSLSTAQSVLVKTLSGSGVSIPQGARVIAICDGTDVSGAQSVSASSSVSLVDGSAATPSLNFASQTNTGIYKAGTQGVGVAVNGVGVTTFDTAGAITATIGANNTQRHTVPAVASDTVTLLAATQSLTNKTVALGSNTVSGTLAQFNTACSDADFASLATTQTLTNKTIASATNNVEARSLKSATTVIDVSAATAPVAGQVLTASSGTVATWVTPPATISSVTRSVRTSDTVLSSGDKGTLIDVTSGTFTQTLTAASSLGSGWWCYIKNSGTGVITLDPNSSETIDDKATIVMYQGESFLLMCNGVNFYTVGRQLEWTLPETTISAGAANITVTAPFSDTSVTSIVLDGTFEVGTGTAVNVTCGGWPGSVYYTLRQTTAGGTVVAATQSGATSSQITNSLATLTLNNFNLCFESIQATTAYGANLVSRVADINNINVSSVQSSTAAKPTSLVLTPNSGTFSSGGYRLTVRRS